MIKHDAYRRVTDDAWYSCQHKMLLHISIEKKASQYTAPTMNGIVDAYAFKTEAVEQKI